MKKTMLLEDANGNSLNYIVNFKKEYIYLLWEMHHL
jgi:hypothetical protein